MRLSYLFLSEEESVWLKYFVIETISDAMIGRQNLFKMKYFGDSSVNKYCNYDLDMKKMLYQQYYK